jgi:hypothetical protein
MYALYTSMTIWLILIGINGIIISNIVYQRTCIHKKAMYGSEINYGVKMFNINRGERLIQHIHRLMEVHI